MSWYLNQRRIASSKAGIRQIAKWRGTTVPRQHTSGIAPTEPFWNCRLSRVEWGLFGLAVMLTVALHLTPVQNSGLGWGLLVILAGVCCLSPVTGFFFIGACSVLPFGDAATNEILRTVGITGEENLGPSPAKIGIIVWFFVTLVRYRRFSLRGITGLWPVLPWLIWFAVLTGEAIWMPQSEYVKALMYCVMACQLANESKGQFLKCLLGLSLGTLVVMVAYWAATVGLPIEISNYGAEREGIQRIGSVRADAVMVWPALLMGVAGLLGIQIALATRPHLQSSPRWLTYGSLLLVTATLPPMVSTMTHGAYASYVLLVGAVVWAMWVAGNAGAFSSRRFKSLLTGFALMVLIVVGLFAFNAFQMRTKMLSLAQYYEETSQEVGAAASRTGVWHDSIHTIMTYPLFGIRVTGEQEEVTSGTEGYYLSHNVFMDYGRMVGIPGMLLLAFFFFWPAVKMWQSGNRIRYLPFLLVHFAMLIFWMSLSFQFYKTFWALWMLMEMAVRSKKPVAVVSRNRVPQPVKLGSQQRRLATTRTVWTQEAKR
jgi:O-antigen ligase